MAESGFSFKKFIEDSKTSLLSPKEYFASMPIEGGFGEPIIKTLIYGFLAGIFNLLWHSLNLIPAKQGAMQQGGGIMTLINSLVFLFIFLFIAGGLILILSAICSGKTKYETNVRVTASLFVLSPISALMGFLSGINLYLGMIVAIAISLYGIWMLFNALKSTLEAKERRATIASIILAAIPVLMLIGALTCFKASNMMNEQFQQEKQKMMKGMPDTEQMQELLKKMEHMIEIEKQKKNQKKQ